MKTAEFRRRINARYIGFDPDRMKPAHIANGLYLQVLGVQYAAETINRLSVPIGKEPNKNSRFRPHTSDSLLEDLPSIKTKDTEAFNQFRQHLREHLDADSAVFDAQVNAGCAYSAANSSLVTDDRHNDGWAGNFVGFVLNYDFGKGSSPVLEKLRNALSDQTDPLSTMLSPFLEDSPEKTFQETYNKESADHFASLLASWPDELQLLRHGLDTFAEYYPDYLSKERFTRLLVILSGFTLLRYITTLAQMTIESPHLPFLVDALHKTNTRTRFASQLSSIRCEVALFEMYVHFVARYIYEQGVEREGVEPLTDSMQKFACQELCRELETELLKTEIDRLDFDEIEDEQALEVTSRHIVTLMFAKSDKRFLANFFRDVGIRCGILMPRGQAQPKKHFSLQPDTLEAIVLACIGPNDAPLTMGEFSQILWERFGLVIGGRHEDMEILANVAIREINQDDLDQNYAAFTREMVSLGLAREHSDGLVLVRPSWK